MSFIHLHVHSDYSPMEGVSSLKELCETARAHGADTLALTDTNGLYGAIRFLEIAKETGLRPILGAEVRMGQSPECGALSHDTHYYTQPTPELAKTSSSSRGLKSHFTLPPQACQDRLLSRGTDFFSPLHPPTLEFAKTNSFSPGRAVLLVKNPDGYANLCRLLSARHCDHGFDLISAVARYRDGLIILSDDQPALTAWKKQSSADLYVELTPGAMMHQALAFSRRTELPPVGTNRVRFVAPHHFHLHRLLRTIALNTTLSRLPPDACCAPTHWLAPVSTLAGYYPHVPHALANTHRVAEDCWTDWNFRDTVFPAFRQLTDEGAFMKLEGKTYAGAAWRYGTVSRPVKDRIDHELAIIRQKRFAHYFLVVEEIVRAAPRTCGRGSVAASIVSYCLGITQVDPLKHHLFFERFLNPGRHDPPDIDIDFPWDERDHILDGIFDRYGAQRAAMVANQNSLGFRAAVREVAKVYGIAPAEIAQVAPGIMRQMDVLELAESHVARAGAESLCKEMSLKAPWPQILDLALQAQGHFRHLSLHSGGVVIVPDDIRRYVPVEVSAKGLPVIQWEKDQTEDAGLVKIDILGNRSLAVIRDALAAIARNTGQQIDYRTWDPIPDEPTQELIRRGDSMGCFYIESPATRLLLRKLWTGMPCEHRASADVFEYLVIVSSLVRPAAISFVHEFIRRAHGEPFDPLHPVLKEVLNETYGIMVYQEDVTKVAMALAGFTVEDADELRKIISKKHKEKQLRDYCQQFYEGAGKSGASRAVIDAIWAMIMSFAGYSFCKPHSASYAQVSFKSAYLRAHYPAEFMAAVISNEGGYYSAFAYLSEARRMGLKLLPPDVNSSDWAYIGSGRTIRVGLMQVKTLARALSQRLTRERSRDGPFRSFHDFLKRVRPEPAQARTLIRAGCCDSIAGELTRPALLWRLHGAEGPISPAHPKPAKTGFYPVGQTPLSAVVGQGALPIPEEYSANQILQHEIELLGFPLSLHPLELYRSVLQKMQYVPAIEMRSHVGRAVTMIGWLITEKMAQTRDGDPMEFITLEDTTALYDATLFPAVYRRVCQLLTPDQPYLLRGRVEEEFGVATLTVDDVRRLNDSSAAPLPKEHCFTADAMLSVDHGEDAEFP